MNRNENDTNTNPPTE